MRVLICHGYLLRGTGSNQYVQSLARAFCRGCHDVLVMCQDGEPSLDFVSVFLKDVPGSTGPEVVWEQDTEYPGTCTVFKPDIGNLLPVYVLDSYEGYTAKEFPDLGDDEIEQYVESNRRALGWLVEQFAPDAILVNHTVMLPFIARPVAERFDTPYFVSVHGSAVEFTVKRDDRYLGYGAEGLEEATGIFVPSEYSEEVLREVFGTRVKGLDSKMFIVPPGVDTHLFHLAGESISRSVRRLIEKVEERTAAVSVGDFIGRKDEKESNLDKDSLEHRITRINALNPDWLPEAGLAKRLSELAGIDRPFLIFVGKLLETKGVQCIITALPLIWREYPDTYMVLVGFGRLRGILGLMIEAMDAGDIRGLKDACDYGNEHYTKVDSPFAPVLAFLDELAGEGMLDNYLRVCYELDLDERVIFTGYLTPEEHSLLLPHSRAVIIPSLAPEAFGLVAAEAMASGAVPIASDHSGLHTALAPLREAWGDETEELLLGTPEKMIFRIASASRKVLGMPEEEITSKRVAMRRATSESFSWDTVVERMTAIFDEHVQEASS